MGKIFKFDQDVDTDQIIASQYIIYPTIEEMKVHTFESLDADFASQVQPGDYVVASENWLRFLERAGTLCVEGTWC